MGFEKKLKTLLKKSISNQFVGNSKEWPDFIYDDPEVTELSKITKIKHKIKAFVKTDKNKYIDECLQRFDVKGLSETYDLLGDNYSKDILVRTIAFRMLGPSKIKMPLTDRKYWDLYYIIQGLKQNARVSNKHYNFNLFDLNKIGYNVKLYYDVLSIFLNFGLKQYEYSREEHLCKATSGDYVIDGGSCFGDTALYFANQVGPKGKVFAFEFIPDNLKILNINLDLNPDLKRRIKVIENPLWSNSRKDLFVVESGPGSKVSTKRPDRYDFKVPTKSIDDFLKTQNIEKIGFIKLDIEGSELECLKGAKETICKFQPKLAVCLYHDINHFVSIPKYMHSLLPGYDLFIDHYTIHLWETVLYAVPKRA